jgi:hypothetical protein
MANRAGSLTEAPPRRARPALTGNEWLALVVAVGIAHAFFGRNIAFPSAYDATKYLEIARDIARQGLFSEYHFSQLRTYGYPLVARLLLPVAETLELPWRFVVFEAQLAAHVAAALFLRAQWAAIAPGAARVATTAVLVNPVALVYVVETLTESVSLTLLVVVAGCCARLFAMRSTSFAALVAGSVAVGFAIAVRPANLFVLPAWIAAIVAAAWLHGATRRRLAATLLVAVLALAAPLVPQVVNNVRHHDRFTPLVAEDLGRYQQIWGIAYLKYATALPPIELPSIFYENPFAAGRPVDEQRPLAWYAEYPLWGAATLGLHVFGMLDQDLLFTYARDLDPWYRRPLAIVVQGAVAVAAIALVAFARRHPRDRLRTAALAVVITFLLSHIGLHATTAVEMRFGLPLLALAGALSGLFACGVWPSLSRTARLATVALAVAWIVASMPLSDWIRAQSPQIRAWDERARDR